MTEPNFSAIRARLRYDSVDEFIDGYSRYVTAGGMFIPMTPAKLKPVGTTVRFQFVLGDGATALLGEGVVRQIRGLENEDADSPIGMLVKFTKLSQDSKILIDRIIALKEIEKLGVDLLSEETHSEDEDSESEAQAATTGNYSLAELTNSRGGRLASEDDEELGELFTDRTGRLEASELAGLGASSYGDNFNQPNESIFGGDALAAEKPSERAPSFQEWGPEPEDKQKEPDSPVEMAGSGELSLDLFTFSKDDFEAPAPSTLFSSGDSSNELAFGFDFDMPEPSKPVESFALAASSSDEVAAAADIFGSESYFPDFSMDGILDSADISEASEAGVEQDAILEESDAQEDVAEEVDIKAEEQPTSHVVRETRGGLQIKSFDGSADASVDRDFEQFAAGSDDDVDSMFDDVFGDAFGGGFGATNEAAVHNVVEEASETELAESAHEHDVDAEVFDEVSEDIDFLEQAAENVQPPIAPTMPPVVPEPVIEKDSDDISDNLFGDSSEESVAALLFGEESESFSVDMNEESVLEESASEQGVLESEILESEVLESEILESEVLESEVLEAEPDAIDLSEEFDLSEISEEQPAVNIEEEVFEINEMESDSAGFEDSVEEGDVSAAIPELPEIPQAPVIPPPAFVAKSTPETSDYSLDEQSENSSELLSLLGALEASESDDDDSRLGSGLSLSHGLHDKSSPVLDDEPDSFSALLASAQKELDARNSTSEEDRNRDAIDDLLGDDMPMPPIPIASPFAMPEVPDKKRKGFMSKLFGKD